MKKKIAMLMTAALMLMAVPAFAAERGAAPAISGHGQLEGQYTEYCCGGYGYGGGCRGGYCRDWEE